MNQQFLFRMQGQETEPKISAQPEFKIRPIAESQRLNTNTSLNTSTMYQRPAQLQMNEYGGENMTSLHAKLHQEADKIRKWKVQTELEIKQKEKKLVASSAQIETMKKSLLELQLDNERLSSRMQEEIDDRQEVMQKISSTRELCNVLKSTAASLEDRMLRCETEKTELKYTGRETSQYLEELSKKFDNLRLSSENNHQQVLMKYDTEMKEKQNKEKVLVSKCEENNAMINKLEFDLKEKIGAIAELRTALTEKSNTLERMTDSLDQLECRNKILEKDLKITEDDFKESAIRVLTLQDEKRDIEEKLKATNTEVNCLQEAKEKMCQEMTLSRTQYEEDLLSAQNYGLKLGKDLGEEQSKLKVCHSELQEAIANIEKLKSSRDILTLDKTELEMKMDIQGLEISNLRADLDERKEEMHKIDGEMNVLVKQLDREHLCKSQLQEMEKDLEAKICTLKLERDEQTQAISQLEEKIKLQENDVACLLARQSELKQSHLAAINLKDRELEDERSQMKKFITELDQTQKEVTRMVSELDNKTAEIARLQEEIQNEKSITEQCQKEFKETTDQFEELKTTYEEEKKRSDELNNQLKDINLENKEHGKSLTSQQKKLAVQTKHNKDLEKEVKSLKADLNSGIKKNKETEKTLKSLQEDTDELKHTNDDLRKRVADFETEMNTLREECSQEKRASDEAMNKAKEMQEIARKETENAKALTECQLGEMMGTLDSYKQSSEKILADKDAEVRNLKNQLEALESKNMSEKDLMKDENSKLSSNIKLLSQEKEDLCKQLMETADENQSLKKKIQDMEKRLEEISQANKSPIITPDTGKSPLPPVVPVTPQKQQTMPWTQKTPKTPKTPLQQVLADNQTVNGLKTPQRSILRPTSSTSKRRKVAFLPDDDHDLPSSSDDLMELEVETEGNLNSDKFVGATPMSASRTPKMLTLTESGLRMTPKRVSTPLSKPILTSTPKKKIEKIPETPNVGKFTPMARQSKDGFNTDVQKQTNIPKTPNIRNVPAKKTSKFFTTSPKDKAVSRTRIKDKGKKEKDSQLSWFDLDSVYGFDPED